MAHISSEYVVSVKNIDIPSLKTKAVEFRKEILQILNAAGSGHPGGSLSMVEILISLYSYQLKFDPKNPRWEDRDRVVISKGHASAGTYVVLANYGFFPKEELKTYRKFGSRLQGHVHVKVPGVEFNTGSLGHGLSFANGVALAAKMRGKSFKAYCIMGDGEIQEGSVWEAAMTASHWKIDNICAIVDYNKCQENGPTNQIKNLEPLAKKWESFGWHAIEIDGHNFEQLISAFDEFGRTKGKPTVIIANTIKGKGISFMEGQAGWHGKAPNAEQLAAALKECV
jgi:transketolase